MTSTRKTNKIKIDLEKAKLGDEIEVNKLIEKNLNYINSLAYKYSNSKEDMEDLVSEGIVGLLKALKNFDLSRNNKFITYAFLYIKSQMLNYKNSIQFCVHIPGSELRKYLRHKKDANLNENSSYEVNPIEQSKIERSLDISSPDLKYTSKKAKLKFKSDSKSTISQTDLTDLKMDIENLLSGSNLSDIEKYVLKRFYFENFKTKEISKLLSMSERDISKIRINAIKKIRKKAQVLNCI